MVVSIDKFWIEGLIKDFYPDFVADRGADIDGKDGIKGKEVFRDYNGNELLETNKII